MKKNLFVIATATLLLFANATIFAKASAINYVTPKMQDGLQQEFGTVQNISWTKRADNQVVASFVFNNHPVDAYFNSDGDYAFSTSSVSKESLPIRIGATLNKNFADKNIRSVLQMSNAEGTSYFIMASDTNGKTKVWKAYSDGQIELFKTI